MHRDDGGRRSEASVGMVDGTEGGGISVREAPTRRMMSGEPCGEVGAAAPASSRVMSTTRSTSFDVRGPGKRQVTCSTGLPIAQDNTRDNLAVR